MTRLRTPANDLVDASWDTSDESVLDAAVEAVEAARSGGILIIDDDQHVLSAAARLIAGEGLRAICCGDPLMAVHIARSAAPEAIILDLLMPEVDGWDVLTALRTDPETRSIPVYMCSILAEGSKARRLGANGSLSKPLDVAQLHFMLDDIGDVAQPVAQSSSR